MTRRVAVESARLGKALLSAPKRFSEFWPQYVSAHRDPRTRLIHVIGTLAGWVLLLLAIWLRRPWLALAALVVPYALAWFSHFYLEHNRPATFDHPLWSFLADQKMVVLTLIGKMGKEVRRCFKEV
jgi:hypothetical protein